MRKVLPMSRIREMEPYMDAKVLDYIHEGQIEAFEGFEDFDLIAFDWYDVRSERTAASQMLLYLDREDLFVFCEDDAAEDAAQAALLVPEEEALSNEQVLHRFFVRLLRGDMAHLDRLEVGDTFTITVLDRVLTYEVDQISIVLPTETDNLKVVDGKDYVTLMTCTPYGINSHRLLVRGRRIETPDKLKHIRVTADAIKIEPIITAPIMALPLLLVLLLWLLFSNRKRKSTRGEKHETH